MYPRQHLPEAVKRQHWFPAYWQFLIAIIMILLSGIGLFALAQLLNLPEPSNCDSILLTAPESERLYCAQEAANHQTVDDLLSAIALVSTVAPAHPLRPTVNRSIEQWSMDILEYGEAAFQEGKLEEAITITRQIPLNTSTNNLVSDRIKRWKSSWSKAEVIYQDAEAELRENQWQQAYSKAIKLLNVGNKYWQKTKYQQLMESIEIVQKDSEERQEIAELAYLDKARTLAMSGEVDGVKAAIVQAERVTEDSRRYEEAQQLISIWRSELKTSKDRSDANWGEPLPLKNGVQPLPMVMTQTSQLAQR